MRVLLACALVLGTVGTTLGGPVVLNPKDLGDFAVFIPLDRVWGVLSDYMAYDPDVKNVLGFLHTQDFKNLVSKLDSMPEFREFLTALEESGYDAYKHWNIFHTALGLPELENPLRPTPPTLTGGLEGMIKDIRALVKEGDIKRVYEEKLKSNPRLQMLVQLFKGDKFQNVLQKVAALPEVAMLLSQVGDLRVE